uniref:Ring finger protein 14 n=1 Tax=Mus musculus TaxID=10090 RepID=A0A494BA93_MOUSE
MSAEDLEAQEDELLALVVPCRGY